MAGYFTLMIPEIVNQKMKYHSCQKPVICLTLKLQAILSWDKEGIMSWPIWEKEISRFDWQYDQTEECYLLEGNVAVETDDGEKVQFGKGDFVRFPKGLSCVWDIKEPVKKHYNFK